MSYSLVSIVPAAHHGALEALGRALGLTPGDTPEHGIALSPTGVAPATHYGLRAWAATTTRVAFEALKSGALTPPAVDGYTPAQIAAAITAVAQDWRDDEPGVGAVHWATALQSAGLMMVAPT